VAQANHGQWTPPLWRRPTIGNVITFVRRGSLSRPTATRPCAEPQARVKGRCGARFTLHVRFHAGHKQLPIVTLRKTA
jgi:hypothetical protein